MKVRGVWKGVSIDGVCWGECVGVKVVEGVVEWEEMGVVWDEVVRGEVVVWVDDGGDKGVRVEVVMVDEGGVVRMREEVVVVR